ncbi:ROK family protein [Actinophytocola oryzae]|uniref:Glucokinase n=1 Tax=Actinophytocola oryzae TaxID=502181 RepID=A0A4R7VMK5_9PSEU|nr:ROK family protein [Actinophytocola oryzae]TDV50754.1 glucokinase [Actinophytocola oryzae]
MLAVDIGGTKIACGIVDSDGRLLRHATRPTGSEPFASLRAVVAELEVGAVDGVGIGCAGPIDTVAGTVSPINIPSWRDFPLVARVQELVGAPVSLAGDAVCVALGEHWVGAGQGSRAMLGMVVSTGIGGGLVLDGRPFAGLTGNAGHVGHVVVEPDGDPCTCGGHGCAETVASGPHLVRWARTRGWAGEDARALAASALAGDAIAAEAFRRSGRAVGLAIVATAAVCDLDLAVVGGGVAQTGDLLFDPVRATLARHAGLSYLRHLRVEPARLGTTAGLYGAARLAYSLI